MTQLSSQEWFLEVDGKKTGPFSAEQVVGLLEENEILDTQRVTHNELQGRWITARELANSHSYTSGESPLISKSFSPPPRPTELNSTNDTPVVQTSDPALSLFDALQAAKDRKTSAARPPSPSETAKPNPFDLHNVPAKAWMIAGITLLLSGAIWGMVVFIKQKTPPNPQANAPFRATPPRATALTAPPPVPPSTPVGANGAPPVPPPGRTATGGGAGNPFTGSPAVRGNAVLPGIPSAPPAIPPPGSNSALSNQMPPNVNDNRGSERDAPSNPNAEPEPIQPPPPPPLEPPSPPQNFEVPAPANDGVPPPIPPMLPPAPME